jgi:hypothetical protein
MAEQSFPFENIDTTEDEFSQWASNFQDTGVQGSPTGTELKVTAEGSELIVNVALGQAFLRGHYYISTDTVALTVPGAGVETRIDYVVIELDPAANTIVAKLVSGTAVSENPVAPTLTQSATGVYQLPVALLTIPNSTLAITNEMLTDVRVFMANRVGIWTTATRPAVPTDYQTLGYNTTTGSHEVWNGSDWVGFMEPISTAGDLIIGDVTGQASRLPIGADEQIFTVIAGAPVWADAASSGGTIYEAPTGLFVTIDTSAYLEGNKYWLANAGNTNFTFALYDTNDTVLFTTSISDTTNQVLVIPANVSYGLIDNYNGSGLGQLVIREITNTPPATTQGALTINGTQSITLESDYDAFLLGGGGGGSGYNNSYRGSSGGGGGSGYYASGILTAGTYTATIGAGGSANIATSGGNGGATSIGALSAAGGSGGLLPTSSYSGGIGGAGGSGGGGGGGFNQEHNSNNVSGALGANGGAGDSAGGTSAAGGAGSGVAPPNPVSLRRIILLDPADTGTTSTYRGEAGGVYAGGSSGGAYDDAVDGGDAYSKGAGGGSARAAFSPGQANKRGGNGANGVIFLRERI